MRRLPRRAARSAEHGSGAEGVRAFVKECAANGAKVGEVPALGGERAQARGIDADAATRRRRCAPPGEQARESGRMAHGPRALRRMPSRWECGTVFASLYHCTYADEEAIDMLAARKAEIFVAPTIGIVQATLDAGRRPTST